MNVVHIRQSCPPPTSFIAIRTCRIRTKSRPSALCSNTRCMAPYCVPYLPTYTLLKFQPFKTCANSAFVKPNGWRINKDYSILFYSILDFIFAILESLFKPTVKFRTSGIRFPLSMTLESQTLIRWLWQPWFKFCIC